MLPGASVLEDCRDELGGGRWAIGGGAGAAALVGAVDRSTCTVDDSFASLVGKVSRSFVVGRGVEDDEDDDGSGVVPSGTLDRDGGRERREGMVA